MNFRRIRSAPWSLCKCSFTDHFLYTHWPLIVQVIYIVAMYSTTSLPTTHMVYRIYCSPVIAHFMHGVLCWITLDLLLWNVIVTYVVPYVPFYTQFEVHVLAMCTTVWVKKVPLSLKLFAIFSLVVNLCNWKLPWLLAIYLHQFWSIYLNMNCIICTSKTPKF